MAKSRLGGRRTLNIANNQQTEPTPQPQQTPPQQGGNSTSFSNFLKMSEAEQALIIKQASPDDVPVFLDNTGLQQLAFLVDGYGLPQVVDDSELDKIKGTNYYRTVSTYKNRTLGTNYTSKEIADQTMYSDYAVYNAHGGMAYGNGLYFADDYNDSVGYGNTNDRVTMRMKVTGKTIRDSALTSKLRNDTGALAKAIRSNGNWDTDEKEAVYAICKGYTGIDHGGYMTIVNRSGIVMSKKVKDTSGTKYRGGW